MNKEDLIKLKNHLPTGARKRIARETGYRKEYIDQIMNGHRNNDTIILKAVEIVSEHKKNMQEATAYIQSL